MMTPQAFVTRRFGSFVAAGLVLAAITLGGKVASAAEPADGAGDPVDLVNPYRAVIRVISLLSHFDVIPTLPVATMERPRMITAMYGAAVALHTFDVVTTARAIQLGGVEQNPLLGSGRSGVVMGVAKGGVTFATVLVAERLWRQDRKAQAIAMLVLTNGLMTAVTLHNSSVVRRLR